MKQARQGRVGEWGSAVQRSLTGAGHKAGARSPAIPHNASCGL